MTIPERTSDFLNSLVVGEPGDWATGKGRIAYPTRAQVLELAVAISRGVPGNIVEFGTWQGHSTRVIRDELWRSRLWQPGRRKRIFACDSFEGLAEDYEHLKAGTFKTAVPKLTGVRIVKGYFDDTSRPSWRRRSARSASRTSMPTCTAPR